jgi:guanosine-3',5'-bis(diphosphate) 3'-pyrophosphohydrolase
MRTLDFQPPGRQQYIAKETIELYAPLANRLGINWMKVELEDLAFQYLNSEAYLELARRVAQSSEKRDQYTEEVRGIIRAEMEKFDLKVEVDGRAKHFFSIYKKMEEQHLNFDEVYDLMAFRVILDSDQEKSCYEALSVVHALWKPVPGRFKDYIAMPKANNYRSLHTTVIGPHGQRVEIQIRTRAMHEWAEEGIAAHWRYKEKRPSQNYDAEQIKRLRELLESQQELKNPREFMSNLKMALFPDEVYVFTPNGDVKSFPKGATPLDYAYSIHTDVGNQCIGAKINRNIVPLKYQLQNGDMVEIISQSGHHPSKDWLKYAVTSRARSKIKNWIKTEERTKSIDLGRDLLEKEFKRHHLKFGSFAKSDEIKKIFEEYKLNSLEELLVNIGYGKLSPKHVVRLLLPEEITKGEDVSAEKQKRKAPSISAPGISLTGIEDVMVRYAKCCEPIPGDEIIGFISRGRGITIHTTQCPHIQEFDSDRLIDVQWSIKEKHSYPVGMRVVCKDKKGLVAELSAIISSLDINISHAEIDTRQHEMQAICDFKLDVSDLNQFNAVVAAMKKLKSVISVERIAGA